MPYPRLNSRFMVLRKIFALEGKFSLFYKGYYSFYSTLIQANSAFVSKSCTLTNMILSMYRMLHLQVGLAAKFSLFYKGYYLFYSTSIQANSAFVSKSCTLTNMILSMYRMLHLQVGLAAKFSLFYKGYYLFYSTSIQANSAFVSKSCTLTSMIHGFGRKHPSPFIATLSVKVTIHCTSVYFSFAFRSSTMLLFSKTDGLYNLCFLIHTLVYCYLVCSCRCM